MIHRVSLLDGDRMAQHQSNASIVRKDEEADEVRQDASEEEDVGRNIG